MLNKFLKIRKLSQNPGIEVGKLILERSEPHTSQTSQGSVCKDSDLLLCGHSYVDAMRRAICQSNLCQRGSDPFLSFGLKCTSPSRDVSLSLLSAKHLSDVRIIWLHWPQCHKLFQ